MLLKLHVQIPTQYYGTVACQSIGEVLKLLFQLLVVSIGICGVVFAGENIKDFKHPANGCWMAGVHVALDEFGKLTINVLWLFVSKVPLNVMKHVSIDEMQDQTFSLALLQVKVH